MKINGVPIARVLISLEAESSEQRAALPGILSSLLKKDPDRIAKVIDRVLAKTPNEGVVYFKVDPNRGLNYYYSLDDLPEEVLNFVLFSVSSIKLDSDAVVPIQLYQLPDDLQEAINVFGKYGIPVDISVEYYVNGKKIG